MQRCHREDPWSSFSPVYLRFTNDPTWDGNKTRREEEGMEMQNKWASDWVCVCVWAAETKGSLEGLVKRQTKKKDSVRGIKMANRDSGGRWEEKQNDKETQEESDTKTTKQRSNEWGKRWCSGRVCLSVNTFKQERERINTQNVCFYTVCGFYAWIQQDYG